MSLNNKMSLGSKRPRTTDYLSDASNAKRSKSDEDAPEDSSRQRPPTPAPARANIHREDQNPYGRRESIRDRRISVDNSRLFFRPGGDRSLILQAPSCSRNPNTAAITGLLNEPKSMRSSPPGDRSLQDVVKAAPLVPTGRTTSSTNSPERSSSYESRRSSRWDLDHPWPTPAPIQLQSADNQSMNSPLFPALPDAIAPVAPIIDRYAMSPSPSHTMCRLAPSVTPPTPPQNVGARSGVEAESRKKIVELQQELASSKEEILSLKTDNEYRNREQEAFHKKVSEFISAQESKERELEKKYAERLTEDLLHHKEELQAQFKEAFQECSTLARVDIGSIRSSVGQIHTFQSDLARMKKSCANLKLDVQAVEKDRDDLLGWRWEVEKEVKRVAKDLTDVKDDTNALRTRKGNVEQDVAKITNNISNVMKEMSSLKDIRKDYNGLARNLGKLEGEKIKLQSQIANIRTNTETAFKDTKDLLGKINSAPTQDSTLEARVNALEVDQHSTKDTLGSLNEVISSLKTGLEKAMEDNNRDSLETSFAEVVYDTAKEEAGAVETKLSARVDQIEINLGISSTAPSARADIVAKSRAPQDNGTAATLKDFGTRLNELNEWVGKPSKEDEARTLAKMVAVLNVSVGDGTNEHDLMSLVTRHDDAIEGLNKHHGSFTEETNEKIQELKRRTEEVNTQLNGHIEREQDARADLENQLQMLTENLNNIKDAYSHMSNTSLSKADSEVRFQNLLQTIQDAISSETAARTELSRSIQAQFASIRNNLSNLGDNVSNLKQSTTQSSNLQHLPVQPAQPVSAITPKDLAEMKEYFRVSQRITQSLESRYNNITTSQLATNMLDQLRTLMPYNSDPVRMGNLIKQHNAVLANHGTTLSNHSNMLAVHNNDIARITSMVETAHRVALNADKVAQNGLLQQKKIEDGDIESLRGKISLVENWITHIKHQLGFNDAELPADDDARQQQTLREGIEREIDGFKQGFTQTKDAYHQLTSDIQSIHTQSLN